MAKKLQLLGKFSSNVDSAEIEQIKKDIADLKYKPIVISSFTNDIGTVEMGSYIPSVTLKWSINNMPELMKLNGEPIDVSMLFENGMYYGTWMEVEQFTKDTTWTLEVVDERENTASKTTSISFENNVYYGTKVAPDGVEWCYYNEEKLPALPTYDSTKYPYAYILDEGDDYTLVVTSAPFKYIPGDFLNDGYEICDEDENGDVVIHYLSEWKTNINSTVWTPTEVQDESFGVYGLDGFVSFLWSNDDILNAETGDTAFESSIPVPTESNILDSEFVNRLSKKVLTGTRKRSFTITAADGEYIWYCVPTRLGKCNFSVGGFDGGFTLAGTILVTNSCDFEEEYYVYRSDNAGLGATTVEVK